MPLLAAHGAHVPPRWAPHSAIGHHCEACPGARRGPGCGPRRGRKQKVPGSERGRGAGKRGTHFEEEMGKAEIIPFALVSAEHPEPWTVGAAAPSSAASDSAPGAAGAVRWPGSGGHLCCPAPRSEIAQPQAGLHPGHGAPRTLSLCARPRALRAETITGQGLRSFPGQGWVTGRKREFLKVEGGYVAPVAPSPGLRLLDRPVFLSESQLSLAPPPGAPLYIEPFSANPSTPPLSF